MMRLLMIAPYYAPDLGPSAPLFTMLSVQLARRGHQVTVITTVPHYPSGYVPSCFRGRCTWRSLENGVRVFRVALPSVKRANLFKRMAQFFCYQLGATWVGWAQSYDAVFVANPALWVWLPFMQLVVFRQKPAVYSIYDVYPDVGTALGIFRHKPVIAAVTFMERFCINHSSVVRIISNSFKPGLRRLGVSNDKLELVYDWVDTDLICPLPRENAFAKEHNLTDQFVVMYAGNLGLSQALEHVLSAAEKLVDHQDICFVLVGGGPARERLIKQVEQRNLINVKFIPFQSRHRLPEVLASADVSLVSLQRGIGVSSLPSKTYSILASGRPLVVSIDEGSETWNLVKMANAGLCVPPENPSEMAEAVLTLKNNQDLRERFGKNGRIWAEQHHSPQSAAVQFEKLLSSTISSKPP